MNTSRLAELLPGLTTRHPVTVIGAAVIDVIADAYALPWRGCDIELKQQGVNVGGCALNIAVALKRLGIDAGNALPLGQGVWAEIIRNRMAKEGLHSLIETTQGDNGWCLALVEPDGGVEVVHAGIHGLGKTALPELFCHSLLLDYPNPLSLAFARQLPRKGELFQLFRTMHKARPSGELAKPSGFD